MVVNSQQFNAKIDQPPKKVSKVNVCNNLEHKLDNLTNLVQQLAIRHVKTYDICSTVRHPTNMCPTLQEGNYEQANVARGFQVQRPKLIHILKIIMEDEGIIQI